MSFLRVSFFLVLVSFLFGSCKHEESEVGGSAGENLRGEKSSELQTLKNQRSVKEVPAHEGADFTTLEPRLWEGRTPEEEIARLKNEGQWDHQKTDFFSQWAAASPHAAIRAAREGEKADITMNTAAAVLGWAEADFKSSLEWIQSQPRSAERAVFINRLRNLVVDEESKPLWREQANLLQSELETPGVTAEVNRFVRDWIEEDLSQTIDWIDGAITEPRQRALVFNGVVNSVSVANSESFDALMHHIQALDSQSLQDELRIAIVKNVASRDYLAAQQWADTITDTLLKEEADKFLEGIIPKE